MSLASNHTGVGLLASGQADYGQISTYDAFARNLCLDTVLLQAHRNPDQSMIIVDVPLPVGVRSEGRPEKAEASRLTPA